jgi:hypothetical protein
MATLTPQQLAQYDRDGYLLVSGLIPEDVAAAAEAAMWRAIGATPGDPASWADKTYGHERIDDPAVVAVYTPEFRAAAAALTGDDVSTIDLPDSGYAINVYPQQAEWKWPHPHIDHAIKEDGHKTFPRAFRVATMTFLNDVPLHGAGTVVWPGSHHRLEALAKSDPYHYGMMWVLNQELERADLGLPVELTPKRGDVLFYHYLCAHAGSMNTSYRPRFALNAKW